MKQAALEVGLWLGLLLVLGWFASQPTCVWLPGMG